MAEAVFKVPPARNEVVRDYIPGSQETLSLQKKLASMSAETLDIPLIIGGKEIRTGKLGNCVMPHQHQHILGHYHQADASHVAQAVAASQSAWTEWSSMDWQDRAAIFLKAADLLAGPYRDIFNAATMLCQSKTVYQAEIDAVCELVDFLKFNAAYLTQLFEDQPRSPEGLWNRTEHRALEGFVFSVTPFNFTSIAANLCTAPALMGNVIIWKPSDTAVYSGYYVMRLLEEAGLPPGVINFLPGPPAEIGDAVLARPELAGIHFTGSTPTFQHLWRSVGSRIDQYSSYPRLVGETGGKDFIFADESADLDALAVAMVRGAYEYQGQKCSAASRAYIPSSIWPSVKERMVAMLETLSMGDVADFSHFMGAVIDQKSFDKCQSYILSALKATDASVLFGGRCDDSEGYFVDATLIETGNPTYASLCEEIFGPILTVFPYAPNQVDETLRLCDQSTAYALTGAVFSQDRRFIAKASQRLRYAAGNFYINDKPTGAVVGQQPFGGSRASGTNDKAGSYLNLTRWTSVRSIKENFLPPKAYRYPHQR